MKYLSVLIIEDDFGQMNIYKDIFDRLSPETKITGVDNLSSAKKAIKNKEYELYICDCDFPTSDRGMRKPKKGAFFDFYKTLKDTHKTANIIVLSHLGENVNKAKELGLNACMKGSFSIEDLIQ